MHRFTLGRTRPPGRSLGWEYLHQGARVDFELLRGIEPWLTPRHSTPFQHGRVRPRPRARNILSRFRTIPRNTIGRWKPLLRSVPEAGCLVRFKTWHLCELAAGTAVSDFSKGIHVMAGDLSQGSRRKNCLKSLLKAPFEMYTEHLTGRAHMHIFLVHVSHFHSCALCMAQGEKSPRPFQCFTTISFLDVVVECPLSSLFTSSVFTCQFSLQTFSVLVVHGKELPREPKRTRSLD